MKAYFILYNQINLSYFDTKVTDRFLYVHHNWKINFNWKILNLNIKSKILDYALWFNFVKSLNDKWYNANFKVEKNFFSWILSYCKDEKIDEIIVVKPTENYVYENFKKIKSKLEKEAIKLTFIEDNSSFLLSHKEFLDNYKTPPVMEVFYRFMRKKHDILMDSSKPVWWKWNFDKENRWFDKNHIKTENYKSEMTIGLKKALEFYNYKEEFNYPTDRNSAIKLLNFFIKNNLDNFWRLEDAMYEKDDYVYHSNLSTAINFWLLSPLEVINIINKQDTSINNKEWFIRQILWWREYMYHFFHFYKDTIYENNFLNHKNDLPTYFRWDDIDKLWLNCLKTSIKRVLSNSYGHHIERLMIIGSYTLLNSINPLEVNRWFFEMYTDAFEWVVTPNVLSMSQYSDAWKLATKPYVSSWNYINKMSDFCTNCEYNVKNKYEKDSCPFNFLYWNFVNDNKEIFKTTRQPFVVKNLEKIDIEKIKQIKEKFKS